MPTTLTDTSPHASSASHSRTSTSPAASTYAADGDPPPTNASPAAPRRRGGRIKDAIWNETTILPDKSVVCNHCRALIHRYGCAKVERVRAHFQNRCLSSRSNSSSVSHTGGGSTSTGGSNGSRAKKQKTAATSSATNGESTVATTATSPRTANATASARPAAAADSKTNRRADLAAKAALFKRTAAQWIYATAQPFETVEHSLLVRALRLLRTDATFPTPRELSGDLLERAAADVRERTDVLLLGRVCALAIEHWHSRDGAQLVSFAAVCDRKPHMLEVSIAPLALTAKPALFASTAALAPTPFELPVDDLERVLLRLSASDVCAVVTPETTALSHATRTRVQRAHPQCAFFYGCAYRALTLLVCDVQLVLPWLDATCSAARAVRDVVTSSATLQSQLPDILPLVGDKVDVADDDDVDALCALLDALAASERALDTVVSRRDFVDADDARTEERAVRQRVQDFVLGDRFASDIARATSVLRPLQQQLTVFAGSRSTESQRPTLAHVYRAFVDLREALAAVECLSRKEKALVASCVHERLARIYSDAHGVAYVLDPLWLGVDMDAAVRRSAEQYIVDACPELSAVDVNTALEQLGADVRDLQRSATSEWQQLVRGETRAFDFWSHRTQLPALQRLAWTVFSLPATSTAPATAFRASCDRVYTRFRATLGTDALQQLALVHGSAAHRADAAAETLLGDASGVATSRTRSPGSHA